MATPQVGEQGPPEPHGWGFGLGFAVLRDAAASGMPQNAGTWRWGGAYGHSWFVDPARGLSVAALTNTRSEEHTSELQSQSNLVCRLLLEKKKKITTSLSIQ